MGWLDHVIAIPGVGVQVKPGFAVETSLTADSCGGTVAATDPGNFSVTLSTDHGLVYWFPSTGGMSASGGLDGARTVNIRETVADNVDAVDGGSGACTLERSDTLSFTLAAGGQPGSFTGEYSFTVAPAAGAQCEDQLTVRGGGYGALPCTITYALSGRRE